MLNISSQFQDVYINFSLAISRPTAFPSSNLKEKNFHYWEIFIIKLQTVFSFVNNLNFLIILFFLFKKWVLISCIVPFLKEIKRNKRKEKSCKNLLLSLFFYCIDDQPNIF